MSASTAPRPAIRTLDPERLGDHLDRLYRGALALCGSPHRAEDLVQDTYLRVLARPRVLRRDNDLGYLLRALRNTFISQQRAAGRRPAAATARQVERFETRAVAPSRAHDDEMVLFEAIAALPHDFRESLVAIDVVGLSYREAARALGVRAGTVASRVHRARGLLRPSLPTPAARACQPSHTGRFPPPARPCLCKTIRPHPDNPGTRAAREVQRASRPLHRRSS